MSKLTRELAELLDEFEKANWEASTPPGAPVPMSNSYNFSTFVTWLKKRESNQVEGDSNE